MMPFWLAADTKQAKRWTFKPSGAESDLDFNSELDQGYFTVFFLHGLLRMVRQPAYFLGYKCEG